MDKPKLCTATWARGKEVDWWEWVWDEEQQEYFKDDRPFSVKELMALSTGMRMEGWQLCRAVV